MLICLKPEMERYWPNLNVFKSEGREALTGCLEHKQLAANIVAQTNTGFNSHFQNLGRRCNY